MSAIDQELIRQNQRLLQNLNTNRHCDCEIRQLVGEITGKKIAADTEIRLPFYSDFGHNLQIGNQVFINANCFFGDEAGIKLENQVSIGAGAYLISKTFQKSGQILIKKGAQIGPRCLILPGVTIGEGVVVEAGMIVKESILK